MALPVAYTEAELASYMVTTLAPLDAVLGWTSTSPQVLEAVNDALVGYHGGAGVIADATNVPQLRAVARVAVWRAVARATAGNYRFSADQMSFDRGQIHEHAVAMLAEAEREAGEAGAGAAVLVVGRIARPDDPYVWLPDELRVLS